MTRRDFWRLGLVLLVALVAAAVAFPLDGRIRLGLDLKGGAQILLRAKGTPDNPLTEDGIQRLLAVLRNRIDQYGVVEPQIQRQGGDRILVLLPGVEDPDAALDLIGKTALLEFRSVLGASPELPPGPERRNYDSDEAYNAAKARWEAIKAQADQVAEEMRKSAPEGSLVAKGEDGRWYLLGRPYLTGKELKDARTSFDQFGRPVVSLKFNDAGAKLFDEATAQNVGRQIAIVLDGVVVSAPVVQERIRGGEAQISGRFTEAEAKRLAIMLRAGALPVGVEILENRSVGPTLGADSISRGIRAGLIGAGLVALFMLVFYGLMGLAADVALAVAVTLVMAAMVLLKSTLTLPGIGGIILTIGMAVDGNILIYERIKEERRAGKTLLAALDAGFRKALTVILDSNVTTLIAAAVLFYFGTGPIRGFAVTLSIGVVASVFCNVVVTRAILQILMGRRRAAL
ncbi:protein-export membrane protein SecD [Thermanaerovibrio acidaminovorans DSM 6589]|uniref:Protein translocase subunit SecD n=1 Tax=Thermanaerovibrio acidaminovorans (strain ATCC 49978 / DSM 6589 / Su883) TaxID=525903 RepID=D1B608_THEAS|nr:protein translocase subunit SecD [Thermanaerovibrio acidaminovorans]ACZ19449.1 protein-export membrane protein SecD [Thermanaerovibrio acidaminovorans DSM 6589]